jgi:hypothetical protein
MSDTTPPQSVTQPATAPLYEFDVDEPAERCPTCGQPFRTDHLLMLHRGEAHPETLTDAERERYADVTDEEEEQLFIFHIKVVAVITLVMFIFIYTYSFVWL